jgi:hypothetical protein
MQLRETHPKASAKIDLLNLGADSAAYDRRRNMTTRELIL